MRFELNKIHRELEATIIYVTHDQIEALTLGDRLVLMKGGICTPTMKWVPGSSIHSCTI